MACRLIRVPLVGYAAASTRRGRHLIGVHLTAERVESVLCLFAAMGLGLFSHASVISSWLGCEWDAKRLGESAYLSMNTHSVPSAGFVAWAAVCDTAWLAIAGELFRASSTWGTGGVVAMAALLASLNAWCTFGVPAVMCALLLKVLAGGGDAVPEEAWREKGGERGGGGEHTCKGWEPSSIDQDASPGQAGRGGHSRRSGQHTPSPTRETCLSPRSARIRVCRGGLQAGPYAAGMVNTRAVAVAEDGDGDMPWC